MNCHICGKQEMSMRFAHKDCIDGLWKEIARWQEETERLEKIVKALEIEIERWEVARDDK